MSFTLYPAIDLKDGQCVRLLRGEMDQATVFSDSPADQAKAFREAGFTHLHVVDLNGAFEGKAVNRDAVEAILKATDAPVQLGGGIRTRAQIDAWLEFRASFSARPRCATQNWSRKPPAPCRGRSWLASMPRTAWSRSRAGPRPAT